MPMDFWKGSGGVPGDFSYGTIHIISVVLLVLVTIGLTIVGTKLSKSAQRKVIVGAAITALLFEVFWRVIF